ncbi:MAG: CapA family protein, partial [Oscillospiraceae bacterium]|nr:CapA family protein [Oscillospiraceae bacterium]
HGAERGLAYYFPPIYGRVADMIGAADLSVINQETLINALYPPATFPHFSSPVELGDYMIDIGFDVFALANNHTLDLKMDGLFASLDYWDERMESHGVVAVGAYRDADERAVIRTNEKNGVTFSYLSYAESLNGLDSWLKAPGEVGRTEPIAKVLEEIAAAKAVSDVCVVFLHWGVENSSRIHESQRVYAQKLVNAGADIIIGTHPHVLRDIEWYERPDGSPAIVAYSLGNFIGAQRIPQTMIGGLLEFDIVVDYETRAVSFEDARLTPVITHYDRNFANIRLYPLSEYTAETALTHGVRDHGKFDLPYILGILNDTISEEFLVLP